ncbi:hypothetical protein [Pseudoxanthomonas mexicana]
MAKSKSCRTEIGSEAWEQEVLDDESGRFSDADKAWVKRRRLNRKVDKVAETDSEQPGPRL